MSTIKSLDTKLNESEKLLENSNVFEKILNLVKNTKKDWKEYKERLYDIYKKNCETWYSEYYGVDLLRIYKQ